MSREMVDTFQVPVTYTITGWIEIEAPDKQRAIEIAQQLNRVGVELHRIEDSDVCSECHYEEIEGPSNG